MFLCNLISAKNWAYWRLTKKQVTKFKLSETTTK